MKIKKFLRKLKKIGNLLFNTFRKKVLKKQNIKVLGLLLAIILVLFVLGKMVSSIGTKEVKYSAVYNNNDYELMLVNKNGTEDSAVKLSNDSGIYGVKYANTTNRYILYTKNDGLYLYDSHDKDKTIKLCSTFSEYEFSEDDSYVIIISDNVLYSYNYKDEIKELDKDVNNIITYTDKYVIYNKSDGLYIRSLKVKKNDATKISETYSNEELTKDKKYISYINGTDLYLYNISKKKNAKVASNVYDYACGSKNCNKMIIFKNSTGLYDAYYYNGKKEIKIASDMSGYKAYDVDSKIIVYTKNGALYYKKYTKDEQLINNDVGNRVLIYKNKIIYYLDTNNTLYYVKIKGNKVGKSKEVLKNVNGIIKAYKSGYAVISDMDDSYKGTLYLVHNSKATKIDSNVSNGTIEVSNNGKKVYYFKNYESSYGELYYTKGSKAKLINKKVYKYQFVTDDTIYYIGDYDETLSKGNLMRFKGNKSKTLVKNVINLAETPNEYEEK